MGMPLSGDDMMSPKTPAALSRRLGVASAENGGGQAEQSEEEFGHC